MRIGLEDAVRIGEPHRLHQCPRPFCPFAGIEVRMKEEDFLDLRRDRHCRIERGHWLLEDHRDVTAANGTKRLLRQARQVLALK